jgi:hypothetical protein
MNKNFVIAALFGALTADQVMAARAEDDFNLLELEDDDDFAPEDFQELEADVDSLAPKKGAAAKKPAAKKAKADSSDDESTSDDERHEAYKVGDRNTSQSKLAKQLKEGKSAKKAGAKPEKKKKEDAPVVRAQTLESLQQSASDAAKNAEDLKKLADDLQAKVREARKDYDTKYKLTQLAAKSYHEAMDDAGDAKDKMKRANRRLEHEKHEALHEAVMEQKARVKRRRWDEKELKERAKDEAHAAASKAGATSTQAQQAAKEAHKGALSQLEAEDDF